MIQQEMEGFQSQTASAGRKGPAAGQSLCFIWSRRDTCITAALPKIMSKPSDSKRKQGVELGKSRNVSPG